MSPLSEIGRVVQSKLDVFAAASQLLDGQSERQVHAGLPVLRTSFAIPLKRGVYHGELGASIQKCDDLAQLGRIVIVLAVILGPVLVRIGLAGRTSADSRAVRLDRYQRPTGP